MPLAITESADLSALNSFGVGARARRLITLTDEADAPEAIDQLQSAPASLLLGAGSNLLFTRDVDGTVLKVSLAGRRVLDAVDGGRLGNAQVLVEAAAGEPWHDFVLWTLAQGLSGLENLALIPGSVGAAPVQNIGAYGVELSEHLHSVRALSLDDG
ncbi:MAG: UDP-N-acetylenolpyruvoylglucosamine reductase, partial [Pseudomonadota bacterium]